LSLSDIFHVLKILVYRFSQSSFFAFLALDVKLNIGRKIRNHKQMALDQHFQEMETRYDFHEDGGSLKSQNTISSPVDESENDDSGSFECNICLDSVQDPVVTLCGHLYCWPCIYKWINRHSASPNNTDCQESQCPVCKAEVSEKNLVPLYGRFQSTKSSDRKASDLGLVVPQRPLSPLCLASSENTNNSHYAMSAHNRDYPQPRLHFHPYPGDSTNNFGNRRFDVTQPRVGMFGEMVHSRVFGNSATTFSTYPNSYHLSISTNPRFRRHMKEVDKSLSRLCFFMFCCMALCLLFF
ncbi:hypothetical protein Leryth_012713, partial [Lithospermum erythrorhizon]